MNCGFVPAGSLVATDVMESAVNQCREVAKEYPRSTVFTGQLTFRLEKFYHRMLHNETAFAIQRRLQDPLALRVLAGEFRPGDTIKVDRVGAELSFARAEGTPDST